MKTGNTHSSEDIPRVQRHASMEPGHEDREYPAPLRVELSRIGKPQWSPVMKTGNTAARPSSSKKTGSPQWSPVMKTGNTNREDTTMITSAKPQWSPVMKTGNTWSPDERLTWDSPPQWSPVMKTGNTRTGRFPHALEGVASMEPGHEDREYSDGTLPPRTGRSGLNGARS